jgi:hypothetical protein
MTAVSEIYRRVIYQQESAQQSIVAESALQLRGEAGLRLGFDEKLLQRLAAAASAILQLSRRGSASISTHA